MKARCEGRCRIGCLPMRDGSNVHVVVLLALLNGGRFLWEQLMSLEAQTHRNWSLLVSDDGSTDDSLAIIERFACAHPHRAVEILVGPRRGFAQNFLHLLRHAPDSAEYVAFCDQDDIWLPQKLSRAVAALGPRQGPGMAIGRRTLCDASGHPMGMSPRPARGASFGNALLQNIGPGNTMVLNRAAVERASSASQLAVDVIAHDWWCYQLLAASGAQVVFDDTPTILYRQHDQNHFGTSRAMRGRLRRLATILCGGFRGWTDANIAALSPMRADFSAENRKIFDTFVAARQARLFQRLRLFRQSGAHRQGRLENAVVWAAVVFNRI